MEAARLIRLCYSGGLQAALTVCINPNNLYLLAPTLTFEDQADSTQPRGGTLSVPLRSGGLPSSGASCSAPSQREPSAGGLYVLRFLSCKQRPDSAYFDRPARISKVSVSVAHVRNVLLFFSPAK